MLNSTSGLLIQVSVSLVELNEVPERYDELIELVACPETGFLYLFSQQQLQVNYSLLSSLKLSSKPLEKNYRTYLSLFLPDYLFFYMIANTMLIG